MNTNRIAYTDLKQPIFIIFYILNQRLQTIRCLHSSIGENPKSQYKSKMQNNGACSTTYIKGGM